MMTNVQKYWLELASRAQKDISVEHKHLRFFEALQQLAEPWGLGKRAIPRVPEFGESSVAVVNSEEFIGEGVSLFQVTYEYRRDFCDDESADDTLHVVLVPSRVDMQYLAYTVIPAYVEAFDAYRVDFADEQQIDLETMKPRPNPRCAVDRLGQISYFDDFLCRRAFGLSASALVDLCRSKIEHATELHDGAYLVASSRALPIDESQRLSREMRRELVANGYWTRLFGYAD